MKHGTRQATSATGLVPPTTPTTAVHQSEVTTTSTAVPPDSLRSCGDIDGASQIKISGLTCNDAEAILHPVIAPCALTTACDYYVRGFRCIASPGASGVAYVCTGTDREVHFTRPS